jgi:beta-mannanase
MERVHDFLASLKDDQQVPIPVIFRPWHENTGSWFWWGEKLCTAEEYKALWNMLQDYLSSDVDLQLVWAYSPGMASDLTEEKYLERYPGDDRIQLVGIDGYQWGTKEDFEKQIISDLNFLWGFSRKHGKLFALTECGYKNMPDPTWWSSVLKPIMDKRPLSYFLLWRNYKQEYFGPTPSRPELVEDFKVFHDADNVLFLEDIKH